MKMNSRKNNIEGYLYALDGIRAISVILIYIFHLWQQSWIFYTFKINGKVIFDLSIWQRYGYIAIDIFFVLSGFCLFYPIAREMFGEKKRSSWKEFYIKRIRRIIPGYYLILLVFLVFPVFSWGVTESLSAGELFKHYGSHALFLHIYGNDTSGSTVSTAWTLGIEVAFYVVFPLIAGMFRKKPVVTFIVMFIIGQAIRLYITANAELSLVVTNCPLLYIDIFGIGMLSAYFTVYVRHHKIPNEIIMTIASVLFLLMIYYYTKWMGSANLEGYDAVTYHRLIYRFILAWSAAGWLFTSIYSIKLWSVKILGNRFFVFLSTISYSFYLWHQNINIALKRLNIPPSVMEPVMKDKVAMIGYSIISIILSLLIATLSTYLIEQPVAKYGFKGAVLRLVKRGKDK